MFTQDTQTALASRKPSQPCIVCAQWRCPLKCAAARGPSSKPRLQCCVWMTVLVGAVAPGSVQLWLAAQMLLLHEENLSLLACFPPSCLLSFHPFFLPAFLSPPLLHLCASLCIVGHGTKCVAVVCITRLALPLMLCKRLRVGCVCSLRLVQHMCRFAPGVQGFFRVFFGLCILGLNHSKECLCCALAWLQRASSGWLAGYIDVGGRRSPQWAL